MDPNVDYDLSIRDVQLRDPGVRHTLRLLRERGHKKGGEPYMVSKGDLEEIGVSYADLIRVQKFALDTVVDKEGNVVRPLSGILSRLAEDPRTGQVGFVLAVNLVP
jgi:hypothetical protein